MIKYIIVIVVLCSCSILKKKSSTVPARSFISKAITLPNLTTKQMSDSVRAFSKKLMAMEQSQRAADTLIFRDKDGQITFQDTVRVNILKAKSVIVTGPGEIKQ